jgi:hypothetical protein
MTFLPSSLTHRRPVLTKPLVLAGGGGARRGGGGHGEHGPLEEVRGLGALPPHRRARHRLERRRTVPLQCRARLL